MLSQNVVCTYGLHAKAGPTMAKTVFQGEDTANFEDRSWCQNAANQKNVSCLRVSLNDSLECL